MDYARLVFLAINKRLKNVFESGELDKDTTISKMETVY